MNHILTFKIVYLYNGCKRSIFIDTTMDLDMLNLQEMESFLEQSNIFKFDTVLTWNYVEIVGIIEGAEEAPKCNPTLKWGRKKTDKTPKPQVSK